MLSTIQPMEDEYVYEASRRNLHDNQVSSDAPDSKYIRRNLKWENIAKSRISNAGTETGKRRTKVDSSLAHNMDRIPNDGEITCIKAKTGGSKRLNDIEASSSESLVTGSSSMNRIGANGTRSMSTLRKDIQGDFDARRRIIRAAEIEEIYEYLRGLEEETHLMKRAFLEAIKERKKLIHEVYQQLQRIDGSLLIRGQLATESSFCTSLDANAFEDLEDGRTGTGLSQVLCQVTNSRVEQKL